MQTLIESRKACPAKTIEHTWETPVRNYRCPVIVCPEQDGTFSVLAKRLPGVASQGECELEALRNITEALQGAIALYIEDSGSIPWTECDLSDIPDGSFERWVSVDA